MVKKQITLLLFTVLAFGCSTAQQGVLDRSSIKIEPVLALQLWTSYTLGAEVYNSDSAYFESVDDRLNFQLRRSRIGLKGSWGPRIRFNLVGAADLVGRDALSGTEAGANNGASPLFRLWSAAVQFKASKNADWANVSLGYFPPNIGRESTTSAFRSPSMEKAWSQNYLRRHLVGTGPGRAVGLNVGGRATINTSVNIGYDAGIFNSEMSAFRGSSQGRVTSPLMTVRANVALGDAEKESYYQGNKITFRNERKGVTFGVGGAWQKKSDEWTKSGTLTLDLLANYGAWSLDGDWSWMRRTPSVSSFSTTSQTGYVRLTYSMIQDNGQVFQPSVMNVWLLGPTDQIQQALAYNASMPSGKEMITEIALNWLFHENLKITLAYTLRSAGAGEWGEALSPNNYYSQANIGVIKRGNWIGLGLVAVL